MIKFNRAFAMPNKWTFKIKPIKRLLDRYVGNGIDWIDPFAGNNSPAKITNDYNPKTKAVYHMEAVDFIKTLNGEFKGCIFDPPYSYRQVTEHYKLLGKKATRYDTSSQFYNRVLNPLSNLIRPGGFCLSFGWNSGGMGKHRGFKIIEILLVNHGAHHNDTIVTIEKKIQTSIKGD